MVEPKLKARESVLSINVLLWKELPQNLMASRNIFFYLTTLWFGNVGGAQMGNSADLSQLRRNMAGLVHLLSAAGAAGGLAGLGWLR